MPIVVLGTMRIIRTRYRHTFQKFAEKKGRINLSQNSENYLIPH